MERKFTSFLEKILKEEDCFMEQQELVRNRLSGVISAGLSAASISKVTNISNVDLSRFKNRQINLIDSDLERLQKYLELTQIPTSI